MATPSRKRGNGLAKFAYNFQNGHHRCYILDNYLIFSRSWKYFVGKLLYILWIIRSGRLNFPVTVMMQRDDLLRRKFAPVERGHHANNGDKMS